MMMYFNYFILILLFFSCATKKDSLSIAKEENKKTHITTEPIKIDAKIGSFKGTSDEFKINSVKIKSDFVEAEVSYVGGCKSHTFECIGSSAISKSLPPIRSVELIHHANGDSCKKIVNQKININVSELAYKKETGSEIYFEIKGWDSKVKFIFE